LNAGKNKFHRFKDFDTRGAITRVEFDTGGKNNLIVGVTSPSGSWINKALSMSSKANLFFLSPGGLHVGKGAEFINVPKLTLSTADQLKFSEGVFDVVGTTRSSVQDFRTNPLPGVFGTPLSEFEEPVVLAAGELPGIHLDGISVSLAEELLVNAPGGRVNVTASRLAVGSDEITGRIALTGIAVNVDSDSVLIAKGKSGGGLIEVIESRQNRYESVRQEFIGAEDYVINTAAEGSGPDTAADVSGPDMAADVIT
jgi:filamentous hemagglutinin family protein